MIHNRPFEDDDLNGNSSDSNAESENESIGETDSNTNSDTESIAESEIDSKDNEADIEPLNDNEWLSYTAKFDSLALQVYKDTYDEVMSVAEAANDDNMETDDNDEAEDQEYTLNENVMEIAKKTFRKRLTNMLIICSGLRRDTKYKRLFQKIGKYLSNEVDLHTAISMAIKSSSEIIYEEFKEALNRLLHDDNSSSGEESDSDEESQSSDEETL